MIIVKYNFSFIQKVVVVVVEIETQRRTISTVVSSIYNHFFWYAFQGNQFFFHFFKYVVV